MLRFVLVPSCRAVVSVLAVFIFLALFAVPQASAATTNLPLPLDDPGRWATVTHAGNAPYQFTDAFGFHSYGGVDHEYRISKTETTSGEWLEFVQAYAPFVPVEERTSRRFIGQYITPRPSPDGGPAIYTLNPGGEPYADRMGFRYIAMYCNWLHNGKVNEAWAFQSGAYDTSTFTGNITDGFNDQETHSPGARYWVPSLDEWVKAAFYDPNRYGENQPGYWQYNITSDTAPVSGVPGAGQTNASSPGAGVSYFENPVGSYVGVESPWGLVDVSGGYSEWTESAVRNPNGLIHSRFVCGSQLNQNIEYDNLWFADRRGNFETFGIAGLRLASRLPSPGLGAWCAIAAVILHRGRRSICHESSCLHQGRRRRGAARAGGWER